MLLPAAPFVSKSELINTSLGLKLPHDIVNVAGFREALKSRTMTAFPSLLGRADVTTTSVEFTLKNEAGTASRSVACRTSNGWLCSMPRR